MADRMKLHKQIIEKIASQLPWQHLPQLAEWTIEKAIAIQQIPAPTFEELQRAEFVKTQFEALGLEGIDLDKHYNVYGIYPGQDRTAPAIMVMAHTDTVFPMGTDLSISRGVNIVSGPGLGDNSLGVASLLGLIEMLRREKITPACDLCIVATSCEEGLGDLGGVKAAFRRLQARIKAVINLEGLAFGHIYHSGIAVRRLRITAHADGGHSWLHFGRHSALHGLINLGTRITAIKPPNIPRTTYNIGMMDGGHSINSIATSANMWLDLRSEERNALENIEVEVRKNIHDLMQDDLRFEVEVVGDRPAGSIPKDHILVKMALETLAYVGISGFLETGSTDGNVPLSEGCPTVTIGITNGGNAHRQDEYIELSAVPSGLKQLIILTLVASQSEM